MFRQSKDYERHSVLVSNHIIDEKNESYILPIGFKTSLLHRQSVVLYKMIQMELENKYVHDNHIINTSVGFITEPFGSGKTIIILALIFAKPRITNRSIYFTTSISGTSYTKTTTSMKVDFNDNLILVPTLIFVSTTVVGQWVAAIKKFTDLKVLVVSDVRSLRVFYTMIKSMEINEYDIVIAKNGSVSGQFDTDERVEYVNTIKTRRIYNLIGSISRGLCWTRIVHDDSDISKLPKTPVNIYGLMTWFVSATSSRPTFPQSRRIENVDEVNILKYGYLDLYGLSNSNILKNLLTIKTIPTFNNNLIMGTPYFWVHMAHNKNNKYIKMIGEMKDSKQAIEIMEMLNGDAISTAAQLVGVDSDNIVDIFKKILDNHYEDFSKSIVVLRWISTLDLKEIKNMPLPDEKNTYKKSDLYEMKDIQYNYPSIGKKIEEVKKECIELRNTSGHAIERVKNSIKDGDCMICTSELKGIDVVIVKCCGRVFCTDCFVRGSKLTRVDRFLRGTCAHCRSPLDMFKIIYLNENFDLDTIVNENYTQNDYKLQIQECIEKIDELSKVDIVFKIINGENLPRKIKVNTNLRGLLYDNNILPDPPFTKVIIFAAFDESLLNITKKLSELKLNYKILNGTSKQINDIALEFQSDENKLNILLINGDKYASGLNLQSATDLIFLHKMVDTEKEAQIIGRIQRYIRKYKANIHYILYDGESIPQ